MGGRARPGSGVAARLLLAFVIVWTGVGAAWAQRESAAAERAEREDARLTRNAVLIVRIAQATDWPGDEGARANRPFVIGYFDADATVAALQSQASRSRIHDRTIELRRLGPDDSPDAVDLLWVGGDQSDDLANILQRVRYDPVLTLADSPGFATRGVRVNLAGSDPERPIEINLDSCQRGGLEPSAQLLKLATLVEDRELREEDE